jgi:hypothetical protein
MGVIIGTHAVFRRRPALEPRFSKFLDSSMSSYDASLEKRHVTSLRRFVGREETLYAELLRGYRLRSADSGDDREVTQSLAALRECDRDDRQRIGRVRRRPFGFRIGKRHQLDKKRFAFPVK